MSGSLFIGLMSGTSLDGVDAVLARFDAGGLPAQLARASIPFPDDLTREMLALNSVGNNELARSALAANALARLYAAAVDQLLNLAGIQASEVLAIGAHGQTVRHSPAQGYTIQLNSPALLAELTGISVVADFRSRDVAAGGQGAPLVPVFHAGVFAAGHPRVVLNLGGIANITILRPGAEPLGFDTGPANVLMDMWCHMRTGHPFDADGAWGASGVVHARLLRHFLDAEPWFSLPAPKSTGRDLFHWSWLESRLTSVCAELNLASQPRAEDIQATLRALTAHCATDAIRNYAPDAQDVLVCGGGARNAALMQDLQALLPCPVLATDHAGISSQDVEALAFAWLAWAHRQGVAASKPAVTGARGPRILGACWPA